jgi:hypothetical protein
MRLHTDHLTETDIRDAARKAGVGVERFSRHSSRSRGWAFDVILSGSGTTSGNYGGADRDVKAATWDEWGLVLAELYQRDPQMIAGSAYRNSEHFHWATGDRFTALTPPFQHLRHRWEYQGECVTDAYYTRECDCGAVVRYLAHGVTWEYISDPLSALI